MRLVVDTNILYTFFWEKSFARKALLKPGLELFSPELALKEINMHEADILKKTNTSQKEFINLRHELAIAVEFIPLEEYKKFIKAALDISPDQNDADFFALALRLKLPIWSNDSLLKTQDKITVLSTFDLLNDPEFSKMLFSDE